MGTYKKKVWITGNGFIGKNIFDKLKKNKYEIILTTRKDLDLNNSHKISHFLKINRPNIIINTAGLVGGILRNKKEKYELLSENLKASLNLIDQVYKNYENQTFINISSSCIYPNNLSSKIKEKNLNLKNIEGSSEYYALSKIVSLKMCKELNNRGLNFYTLIPSNLYGPYDDFSIDNSHVIGSLINKLINNNNNSVKLLGSGVAKRDFLYVDDFVEAIDKFISSKKKPNEPIYNLSSSKVISIKELSILIRDKINKKIELIFEKDGNDGTLYKSLDSNLFRKKYNWLEKTSLDIGINKTINYFKKNIL